MAEHLIDDIDLTALSEIYAATKRAVFLEPAERRSRVLKADSDLVCEQLELAQLQPGRYLDI